MAEIMERFSDHRPDSTQERCHRAFASTPFDGIRAKTLVETTSENLLDVLKPGGTSTNNYLRGLHNLALNLCWLARPILAKKAWPPIHHKKRRAVTQEEHERTVNTERCPERKLYGEMLWITGGSQSDIANLVWENIDQVNGVLYFQRQKLKEDHEPPVSARIRRTCPRSRWQQSRAKRKSAPPRSCHAGGGDRHQPDQT